MKGLERVRRQLAAGEFDYTGHAGQRVLERNITELDIRQAGKRAVIVEEYPMDKYSPSCLLLGFTGEGRPLHILVSLADTEFVRIITLYEPSIEDWIDYSQRR